MIRQWRVVMDETILGEADEAVTLQQLYVCGLRDPFDDDCSKQKLPSKRTRCVAPAL